MNHSSSLSLQDSEEYMTVNSLPPKHPSGRTKFRETRHPIYRGVRRRGTSNRWVCEVRNPNDKSRIWLGTFATAEMAARAHDVAVMALRGRSACLNFADSAWLIKLPDSFSSVNDIKKAANEAAENFKCKDIVSLPFSSSSSSSDLSSVEVTEDNISVTVENNLNLEMDYDTEFNMDLGSYYRNLADGIVSPENWFDDLDDDNWGSPVSLWS